MKAPGHPPNERSLVAQTLSCGTRSGLVSLEVTTVGEVVTADGVSMLRVAGSPKGFELSKHSDDQFAGAFAAARESGNKLVRLTGVVANYSGRWPGLLQKKPSQPRRILVTGVELVE